MSEKDEFTFDDNDDFPETDLSGAFEEGEHQALEPPEPEPTPKGGSSQTRILLLVLLLLVACAGGAYYFMGLGGATPEPSKPQAKPQKAVALPPKPAQPVPVVSEAETQQVAVPAPPAEGSAKTVAVPTPQPVPAAKSSPEPVVKTEQVEAPEPKSADTPPETTPEAAPLKSPPEKAVSAETPVPPTTPVTQAVATGPYILDAGSYLLDTNRKRLVKELRELGYQPQITPVEAKVDMIRLRLGSFPESEAQEALDFVRTIEPGAFSVREGDQYVIYAGTFFDRDNVEKLKKRFQQEGIDAEAQPVEVVRTLSRIRFGQFASVQDAQAAAGKVAEAGVKATVVKVK